MSDNTTKQQDSLVPPEAEHKLCWYVVHTYSGYENKVMDTLKKSVENSEKMQDLIFEIIVPEEEVIEIKKGKPVRRAVMEQAARYLESGQLEGLLLVVERSANLPGRILGKPVVVLGLNRLWGVALP